MAYCGDELLWTAMLSDGSVVQLKSSALDDASSSHSVHFSDRLSYIGLVKDARMNESRQQVSHFHITTTRTTTTTTTTTTTFV